MGASFDSTAMQARLLHDNGRHARLARAGNHLALSHTHLALRMCCCPSADWPADELLSGPVLLQRFDAAALREFAARLVPSNMNMMLNSKLAANGTPLKERW